MGAGPRAAIIYIRQVCCTASQRHPRGGGGTRSGTLLIYCLGCCVGRQCRIGAKLLTVGQSVGAEGGGKGNGGPARVLPYWAS